MTQEDKQLLLKDLCARLPYCTICHYETVIPMLGDVINNGELQEIKHGGEYFIVNGATCLYDDIKPYLRPMSSMTEEERNELNNYIFSEKGLRYFWFDDGIMYSGPDNQCFIGLGNDTIDRMMDWLNAHHFDYRGLIEKGLAFKAPKDMYNIK